MTTTTNPRRGRREAWLTERLDGADFALTLRTRGAYRHGADVYTVHRATCPILRTTSAAIHPIGPGHDLESPATMVERAAKPCGRCNPLA